MRGNEPENRNFLPLFFANKGLDAINLGNILHHKSVKAMVPPYFKDHSVPIISYYINVAFVLIDLLSFPIRI
jgi:hypothetical protein